ncbi:UDP-glucuronic acid decarboxylase family protein [Aureimonas ureilytica]|uniref:UDP-glucuronic acid decarboxylase family protein n=1 Tax=Aureimonas ureilytica TaxID=401562 RepID=UPI0003696128|nr:UDP-glucuronic acid decarboxylase family protein [Aureimonas ureilytica]
MKHHPWPALPAPLVPKIPSGKSIAVTGGAGFLGSHLCQALLAQGHHVVCLDNFATGSPDNLRRFVATNRFTLVEQDVVLPFPCDLPRFDEIWNLACPASPAHYQRDPVRTLFICADGARRVLERATEDGARVFHASTSEVYGDPDVHPQPETYVGHVNPVGPRACYDEGKRFAEAVFTEGCARAGLDLRMARIFNTYGPRMHPDDGRVVSNFVVQALRGDDITLYGDGSQTRSFCYVDDLIAGFLALMALDEDPGGPVNLGNPVETRMDELADLVVALTGSRSRIVRRPLPVDDPRRRRPDIAKARALLGWQPAVPLRTGLERTIAHFGERVAAAFEPFAPPAALAAAARPLAGGVMAS